VDQWIEHPNVTAAVLAHIPGQDSGTALVKLLYGEAGFSGKLPYTIAKNESDYSPLKPCGLAYKGDKDPQCDFSEGVYLDYRAFDAMNITPRYEFGYGLSYTTFEYSSMSLKAHGVRSCIANGTSLWENIAQVKIDVTNTGDLDGQEVAQLYLGIPGAPPKQLRGFDKLALAPGQTGTTQFELTKRDFAVWDVTLQQWVVQAGEHHVYVGASSRDIRLRGKIVVSR
jgi:beta-glucosidase